MSTRSKGRPKTLPVQLTIAADPEGASVLLDCQVAHRSDVAPGEEPIVEGRNSAGDTHPAIERAMSWARDNGYMVGVVIW